MNAITRYALFAAVGCGALLLGLYLSLQVRGSGSQAPIEGLLWPNPKPLAPFELTDHLGTSFTLEDLKGGWSLLFFGFTHCPDICPTTMIVLRDVVRSVEREKPGASPRVVLLSVDPERDVPERLGEYVTFFDPEFIGLTGTADAIRAVANDIGIVYMKQPLPGGGDDYSVDHTASILLIDPEGRIVGIFSAPHAAQDIADRYLAMRRRVAAAS